MYCEKRYTNKFELNCLDDWLWTGVWCVQDSIVW